MSNTEGQYNTLVAEYENYLRGDASARNRFIESAVPLIKKIARYAAGKNSKRRQLVGDMVDNCVIRVTEFLDQKKAAENAAGYLFTALKRLCRETIIEDRCFGPSVKVLEKARTQAKARLKANRAAAKKICTCCQEPHETSDYYYITDLSHPRGGAIECRQAHEDRIRRETRDAVYREEYQFDEIPIGSDIEEAIERLHEHATDEEIAIVRLKTSGLSDREIAEELGISRQSVQAKRARLANQLSLGIGA